MRGLALLVVLLAPAGDAAAERRLYVVRDGAIGVHAIDDGHRLLRDLRLPTLIAARGIAAHAGTGRLYVAHYGSRPAHGTGKVLALDLRTEAVVWEQTLSPSVDRLALSPDGATLYVPSGEDDWTAHWFVIDAATGAVTGTIPYATRTHNTIATRDRVYLSTLRSPYLGIADPRTKELAGELGPFGGAIRPFTVNGRGTLVFVNVDGLLGFEVGDLASAGLHPEPASGRVLHREAVEGYGADDPTFLYSHGLALTPDERELWVCSWFQRLHVFDVSRFPPRRVADLAVAGAPMWVSFSLDGAHAYPSTGEVIDTRTRKTVARITPSRYLLEVDFAGGRPVAASDQFGVGRVTAAPANRVPELKLAATAAEVVVDARDPDGEVRRVDLVVRGPFGKVGLRRALPRSLGSRSAPPWTFPLALPEDGRYEITAHAIDDRWGLAASPPISVEWRAAPAPPADRRAPPPGRGSAR